jgi:hypothetical protein
MKPSLIVTSTFAIAVTLAAIGCSKGGGAGAGATATDPNAPKGGSCLQDKAGLCTEFSENPGGLAEGTCTALMKGTYSKSSCPKDNTIGTCQAKTDATYYYFGNASGPWTARSQPRPAPPTRPSRRPCPRPITSWPAARRTPRRATTSTASR